MGKVVLIGATGFVGASLLKELLDRGYEVTAIVRSANKILSNDKVKSVSLDVNNTNELADLLKGHDVVLSAFSAGWTNPNFYEDFIRGSKSIQEASKIAKISRYIVIGGAGSLFINGKQVVDDPNFPENIKEGASAARDYYNFLKDEEKELDWTVFSPAIDMHQGIKTGRTGKYRLGIDEPVFDEKGNSVLSVEDLSVAVVDEIENHKFSRMRFTAGY